MAFETQKREALSLLEGIENGSLGTVNAGFQLDDADPALVYLIFTWLRQRYGADHPAAEGVIGRLVELTSRSSSLKAKMSTGKTDPIVAWFQETYSYRDLRGSEFIDMIVDKLES